MCGLFGMAGNGVNRFDLKIIEDLMLVSSTRGTDGTGLAAGRSFISEGPKKQRSYKIPGDPYYWQYMMDEKKVDDILNVGNTWFIGHTRSRSMGEINVSCCQPYAYNHIVGAHNGTIPEDFTSFNTDSEKFLGRIDLMGTEGLVGILSSLPEQSSYALVWYNYREKALYFLRNKRRTLYFATNNKRAVMYWASEQRFLDFALSDEDYTSYYFAEDFLYKTLIGDIKHDGTYKFTKVDAKPITKEDKVTIIGESMSEIEQLPWIRDTINQQQNRKLN